MADNEVTNYRVIYPNDEGGVSILVPSPSCPSIDSVVQDVPYGKSYEIIPVSAIPTDRTYRNAWTFDEA